MSNTILEWPNFYMEFADTLLQYKDNRTELINKIKNVYNKINIKLPTLETDINRNRIDPYDMDPFTVFALFNKGITDKNRIKILSAIKEEFHIKSKVPTEFTGIPLVNNLGATFYYFTGDRGEKDIDNLWSVFESALGYSKDYNDVSRKNFIYYFNEALQQKGVKWNITMALFWIRPFTFIGLDKKNQSFLKNENNLSIQVAQEIKALKSHDLDAETYLNICYMISESLEENHQFEDFIDLSHKAFLQLEKNNNDSKGGIGDENVNTLTYWAYSPGEGAKMWNQFYKEGIMGIGWRETGDLTSYSNKDEIREKLREIYDSDSKFFNDTSALWQFANDMKKGDIIFAKKGMNEIIGRGVVESGYMYDESLGHYPHIRKVKWTHKGNWPYGDEKNKLHMKTLTDISYQKEKVEIINQFFDEIIIEPPTSYPPYNSEDFLEDVYISGEDYYTLINLLINKKNLIVQGAPGVGKTFMAKRLAYSIMGVKDVDRVMMVQFHQSYSYEDFVMGYRPSKDGFELREGSFYKFCKKAEEDDENDYFFIIDEINRGNLSKIFGELFMLIENDKRGEKNKIQLLYSDELFYIPKNVHIIGLMNTADRSLAMIDYALRRRFAFFDLKPGFLSDGFKSYQSNVDYPIFDKLIRVMEELNNSIKEDETLGEGFRIGHSYFCNLDDEEEIQEKLNYIIEYEIIPLLKEYWFDEPDKVSDWSDKLRNSLKE